MFKSKILLSITSVALLACAQQEEPAPMVMSAEPVYNKMGDVVGCTDGRTFTAGTAPMENPCAPPPQRGDDDNDGRTPEPDTQTRG